jgi:hypothetical protein
MVDTRPKPLYLECKSCGERWKWGSLPLRLSDKKRMDSLNAAVCPHCGTGDPYMCATSGLHAVWAPRQGRLQDGA